MVIEIINLDCVLTVELEYQTPVAADTYGIIVLQTAGQTMQTKSRRIHVLRLPGIIQRCEQYPQPSGMLRHNSCLAASPEEPLQSLVAEIPYRKSSVKLYLTVVKPGLEKWTERICFIPSENHLATACRSIQINLPPLGLCATS